MPIKTGVKACVLALMIAAPWGAEAAGLGRLNVLSGLGQPFRGEIDLVSVQPEEADSLVVSLAPPEAFSAAQVPYPAGGLGLRFQIDKRPNGQYYVVVNSAQAISEPVLDLVVDLNWASGRIQRTYTALIDPVGYNNASNGNGGSAASNFSGTRTFGKAITPSSPTVRSRGGSRRARAAAKAPTDNVASAPVAQAAPAAAAGDNAGADSYTVKSGDTLSSIARSVQPGGVSLEQVLVSLYRNNSSAFDGNMNRLKRGRILQVPTPEKMAEVSRKDAAKEIHLQSQNWHAYRDQVAENAEKTPAAESGNQSTSGKIGAKVEDKGATEGQQSKDVLKLSKGSDKAAANGGSKDAKEEARVGKQKEMQDAQDRVNSLKKNVKDMKGLLAMQGAASAAKATPTPEPTAVPTPAPTPVATAAPVIAAASETASAPVAASDVASAPAAASDVASAPAVVHKRRVIPVTVPVAEPSLMDTIMDDPLIPGGILAVLLLGAGAFFYMRRRKKPAAFEDSIITGGDLKPNTVLGQTGGAVISTQPTENSFLTDFSRQGLGTIDTDEVDPIAEAEVYMAYGRDAQAEEILKDALSKDPSRHEIRMKLLEIYAARKDKTSFEEVATDLYAAQNGRGPLWEQAAYTGRTLDPENPLYGRTEGAAAGAVAEPALGTGALLTGAAVAGVAVAGAAAASEAARHDLDFDLGSDPVAAAEPASLLAETPSPLAPQADAPMFDMPHLEPVAAPVVEDTTATDLAADLGNDLDFDLDQFSVPEAPAAPLAEPTLNPAIDSDPLADLNATADLDHDLDFGLDAGLNTGLAETSAEPHFEAEPDYSADLGSLEDTDLDLDLDLGSLDMPEELAAAPAPAEAQDDLGLDFSFDLNEPVVASPAPAVPGLDTLDLALTPPPAGQDLQSSDFASDDPVQTKIDLARAYIDMGDVEGAREILQEALGEGNANQQTEARSLLDAL